MTEQNEPHYNACSSRVRWVRVGSVEPKTIKLNYVVCLSDTGWHVTVMGSLIILVNKRADWNVPVSYIKYMSICSALCSHFRIIYSFPSRISALFLLHTKTDDAILLTPNVSWFWPSTKSLKLNYVVCLSDTGSSCHVTVMGSLIILVNKRADWNVPVSYIK
jgi:hypothetical protein